MSQRETIDIRNSKFRTDVSLRDPYSGNEYTIECEVDTGCPDAIALPVQYSNDFLRLVGEEPRGGAGVGLSETYLVEMTQFGSLDLSHPTIAVMSLPQSYSHGLIGTDALNYMTTEIYDDPSDKKMDVEPTHM